MFFCSRDKDMIDKYLLCSIAMVNPTFQTELMGIPVERSSLSSLDTRLIKFGVWSQSALEQTRDSGSNTGFQRLCRIFKKRHGPGLLMYTIKETIISSSCTRRNKSQCISKCSCHIFVSRVLRSLEEHVLKAFTKRKNMFSKQARSTGVYQPSGEKYQQIDEKIHDQKSLIEMYFLSLIDNVVTSARSTFGYYLRIKTMCTVSAKGCLSSWSPVHSIHSIEPCHLTSPSHGCDAEWGTDSG
ncbi:hypothetical protein HID58_041055 [Brassica napus]|uniref:Fucosyltransferase n=1 Tax=Brassica napus TaxID=3708 RepID=A0ABQ8BAR4_BRANA|nr:hypothetical protein HID58_041055 [Brassica napus]